MWCVVGDLLSIVLWMGVAIYLSGSQRKRSASSPQPIPSAKHPQTNADRIRAMSDEDLCLFLNCQTHCDSCAFNDVCTTPYSAEACVTGVMKWLQQPAATFAPDEDMHEHSGLVGEE